MKKIILWFGILLFADRSFCQIQVNPVHSKDYYLKKSKNQKTVAWILLGTGTALIGASIVAVRYGNGDIGDCAYGGCNSKGDFWGYAAVVGLAADLTSIPFFISASKNKKRSMSISLSTEKIFLPKKSKIAVEIQPTLTFGINLR